MNKLAQEPMFISDYADSESAQYQEDLRAALREALREEMVKNTKLEAENLGQSDLIAKLEEELVREKDWRSLIATMPPDSDDLRRTVRERYLASEVLEPIIGAWREANAKLEAENADLRKQLEQVTGERDRQYEFNLGQIAKHAALEHEIDALRKQLAAAYRQIECDRSLIADAVTRLKRELDSRHWLTEGRGSYEWDDKRYQKEFLDAGRALLAKMKPLEKLAANLSQSPQTGAEVVAARINLEKQLAAAQAALCGRVETDE